MTRFSEDPSQIYGQMKELCSDCEPTETVLKYIQGLRSNHEKLHEKQHSDLGGIDPVTEQEITKIGAKLGERTEQE